MKVIAVEEHYSSERIWKALDGLGRPVGRPEIERKLLDLGDERIADMDAGGIDVQVLSLQPPGAQQLPASAVQLVREENDRLAETVRQHQGRFAAFAALPTAVPAAAALELDRAVRQLGFKGVLLNGQTAGRFLDDTSFWPIFECAAALDVPIYLHPALPGASIIDAYYQGFKPQLTALLASSAWGWHIETGLHILRLILAGVFDRFPTLQFMIGHMGEALPFMLTRTTTNLPQSVTGLQRSVSDYVRENVHVTTSGFFSTPPLLTALLEVGADRLMFAVDYPFSRNEQGRTFLDQMPVSSLDREKIAHGNAERLLRL
jgi:uncharacterized protein